MDSVFSWFMMVVLVNVGIILVCRECLIEKKQYKEENDRFFNKYDKR